MQRFTSSTLRNTDIVFTPSHIIIDLFFRTYKAFGLEVPDRFAVIGFGLDDDGTWLSTIGSWISERHFVFLLPDALRIHFACQTPRASSG